MQNLTDTAFGLIIAFFLPGLAGLYALGLWCPSVAVVFETFLTTESNVGLFLLVSGAAVAVGLQITLFRWVVFERWLCKGTDARDAKRMQGVEAAVTRHTYYIPKELHRELKVQAAQEDRQ